MQESIRRKLEKLGVRNAVRLVFPLKSRYPGRMSRRIKFVKGRMGYWAVKCKGLSCRACGFPEEPVVRVLHVVKHDVLSGLRHRVPIIIVECCGRIVGEGVWNGSQIMLDDIDCWVEITAGGEVKCRGKACSHGLIECTEECFRY